MGRCWKEFLTRAAPPSLEFDEYLNEYLYEYLYANFYESCMDICMNICIKNYGYFMGRPWREFLTRAAPPSLEFDEYLNEYLHEYL